MKQKSLIIHAASLLKNDLAEVGIYGKNTTAFKNNEAKISVAFHLKRNASAICKLMYEDRNVYLENDIHEKNKLLNEFINAQRKYVDLETFKLLKSAIGHFLTER